MKNTNITKATDWAKGNKKYPVQVIAKHVYGQERIYPINDNAKSLLKLTGLKTFKKDNIKDILDLGYDVEFLPAFTYQQ
jgi:hypothetical protein|tara:strand:+ start:706 stop:942 length:237 start_codon:yes stop_codon:yes gene_type:complete